MSKTTARLIVADHILKTLPSDIAERKVLLQAMEELSIPNSELRIGLHASAVSLRKHESLTKELRAALKSEILKS